MIESSWDDRTGVLLVWFRGSMNHLSAKQGEEWAYVVGTSRYPEAVAPAALRRFAAQWLAAAALQ